jgi:hypothetical protein
MSKKIDFQIRVLKRYGVIPVFEGDPEFTNVKTSAPGETFKQWCARVIGKTTNEVSLFGLYKPSGNTRIGKLSQDGEHLKKLVQAQSRKSFLKGSNKRQGGVETELTDEVNSATSRLIMRDEIYNTLADAVVDRTVAIDEFFNRFADKNSGANGWVEVFEALANEYSSLAKRSR